MLKMLKYVGSHNGFEFNQKSFETFLADLGIKTERSSVYTPEQVVIAKNVNNVVINGVRAMLQHNWLEPTFIEEALLTFFHTRNRN